MWKENPAVAVMGSDLPGQICIIFDTLVHVKVIWVRSELVTDNKEVTASYSCLLNRACGAALLSLHEV